jgi:hypothetical protein
VHRTGRELPPGGATVLQIVAGKALVLDFVATQQMLS